MTGAACVITGDLNGDGIPDLLVAVNGTPNALLSYLGNGDGTFTLKSTTPTPYAGCYVILADFNHDGKLDFAASRNLIALGNGDGTFQTPVAIVSSPPPGCCSNIAVGDNHDAWPDLVLTNGGIDPPDIGCLLLYLDLVTGHGGGATIYLSNGTGAFTFPTSLGLGIPGLNMVADLNGDGIPDVAVLWTDTLTIYLRVYGISWCPTTPAASRC